MLVLRRTLPLCLLHGALRRPFKCRPTRCSDRETRQAHPSACHIPPHLPSLFKRRLITHQRNRRINPQSHLLPLSCVNARLGRIRTLSASPLWRWPCGSVGSLMIRDLAVRAGPFHHARLRDALTSLELTVSRHVGCLCRAEADLGHTG